MANCLNCGKEICSDSIVSKHGKRSVKAYEVKVKKFCNSSCAATYNNKKFPKRTAKKEFEKRIQTGNTNICVFCGANIVKPENNFYCSIQCKRDASRLLRYVVWEALECFIPVGQEKALNKKHKEYLILKRGYSCEICKNTMWCGSPIPLIMDHIDGNGENNSISNIRLVCGNCDMQLPTYKSKNRGHGRAYRRDRYARGISY